MEFVDELPPPNQQAVKIKEMVRELRNNPGKWAIVRTYPVERRQTASSWATSLRMRHGLQAVVRANGDEIDVYARFGGDSQ